jgi:hypothetical protein
MLSVTYKPFMLSVIMLKVIMLSVLMPNVLMLKVLAPKVEHSFVYLFFVFELKHGLAYLHHAPEIRLRFLTDAK